MKKRLYLFFVIGLFLLLLLGCNNESSEINSAEETDFSSYEAANRINDEFSNASGYNGIINERPIFHNTKNGKVSYYLYNPKNDENKKLVEIQDFYSCMRFSVMDGGILYFFLATGEDGVPKLYKLNTETNDIDVIKHNCDSDPTFSICKCGNKLVILSKKDEDEIHHRYIEIYDLDTGEWSTIREFTYSSITMEGEYPESICSDGETIYTFVHISDKEGNKSAIILLDINGIEMGNASLSSETSAYIGATFFADMRVFGKYVYMLNASNKSLIGTIVNNEFVEIHRDSNAEVCFGYEGVNPLFFRRFSNEVYEISESGEIIEYKVPVEDKNSQILFGLSDEYTSYLFTVNVDDTNLEEYGHQKGYVFDREKLGNIYLPS